jgi:hypothetical protein
MQTLLSTSIAVYIVFYVFESLIRYGLNIVGADSLIFLRDAVLIIPLLLIFIHQLLHRTIHPAYFIFAFIIVLHGTVMVLNIGSFMAVAYSTKMLMTLLAGALCVNILMQPSRMVVLFLFVLWAVSWVGILIDKYYVEFPWIGMTANIGDVVIEISRDWMISGESKRAGGFMRSSINAATIEPILALILIFNLRSKSLRILVALLTIPALIWTTQKGPIVAYLLTLALIALAYKRPINALRMGVMLTLVLSVVLPIVLPNYTMPVAEGVFSFSSFYLRVESMWPEAWVWIRLNEVFPFGVGLGGISGAQRMYAPNDLNAADNIFILMYAYFGVMSFVYLGGVLMMVMRVKNDGSAGVAQAMALLVFLFGYGCVISILEDQMASLFLGAAIAYLSHALSRKPQPQPQPQLQPAPPPPVLRHNELLPSQ